MGRPFARRAAVALLPSAALALACAARTGPEPGLLTVAIPSSLDDLDPHARDKLGSASVLSNVYEALVTAAPDMAIRPSLAAAWVNPDSLTWVFHLRPGVVFHDGRPLRAADVVFSFERLLKDPRLEVGTYLSNVSEVRALDALTVEVRTREPARILLNKLSHVPIVPEGSGSEGLGTSPVGTGPYRLLSWKRGTSALLGAHERYWGGAPAVGRALVRVGIAPGEAIRGALAGDYQLVLCDSRKAEAEAARSPRLRVVRRENLFVKYLAFDLRRPPFDDPRVREAVDRAVDRTAMVARLDSFAVPASQLVPRFVFGFDPGLPPRMPDPARSRALLRARAPVRTTLVARRVTSGAAALVKEDLERAGMAVDLEVLPDERFFAALAEGRAPMWVNSAGCASGDASDLFEALFHSADPARRLGAQNFSGFSDRGVDEAIEKSAAVEDPGQRLAALQQIMAAALDRRVAIPLYGDQDVYAVDAGLAWTPRSDSYIRLAEITRR